MAPATLASYLDQLLDLGLGQVLSGAKLGVRTPSRRDCPIYDGWGDDAEGGFHQCLLSWLRMTF